VLPIATPSIVFISLTIFSSTRLKRTGERASPCLQPVDTLIVSDTAFAILIFIEMFSRLALIKFTSFIGKLNSINMLIKVSLWMESYAFSKSINRMYNSLLYYHDFCAI
jgi:hypothetical protein